MLHKTISKTFIFVVVITGAFVVGCNKDTNPAGAAQDSFESLASPYLICNSRNPGGVGFDFVYKGEKGGANNFDKLSVEDFSWDIMIKTDKAEKPDGTHAGMPRIELASGVQAVNYSTIDSSCVGVDEFDALESVDVSSITWQSDDASFTMDGLPTGGSTGLPAMSAVQEQYQKLAIGEKWKSPANNDTAGDEPVWLIKTEDGDIVKFIVSDFPANPADYPGHDPEVTATGFIELSWELLD